MDNISSIILYKDNHYLIVNKPAGIPVQKDKTEDTSLIEMMMAYTKQELHLCNRIDRPVSGIVILARSSDAASAMQQIMHQNKYHKIYCAIVPKIELPAENTLTHFIGKSSKTNKAIISDKRFEGASQVKLHYEIKRSSDQYHLLQVETGSGKFHQIRAQLSKTGIPIKGDVKYGARRANKDRSIGLHAHEIKFIHPFKNQELHIITDWPSHDIWPVMNS